MEGYSKEELYKRSVQLYLESNPNPNSLKFVANFMLVEDSSGFDFPDQKSCEGTSELAQELFNFPYVRRVFIMSNFVTVTKDEKLEWSEIRDEIKDFITEYLVNDRPVLDDSAEAGNLIGEGDTETEIKIKTILDEYVKPAVEQDGGAIVFESFDAGIVKLQLQGSCSGCPSSTITLKAGIENLLKSMVPEVEQVEAESI